MTSMIRAVRFLLASIKQPVKPISVYEKTLVAEDRSFVVDVYEPRRISNQTATILVIHGMNRHGSKDDRIIHLSRALAHCGYRVVAPTYPILTNHWVSAESREDFLQTIVSICADQSLCPTGRVGVFTASFSGFFTLCIANHPKVVDLISGICSVGTCYYAKSTFKNILAEKTTDYYAKSIAVKNLLAICGELTPCLEQALEWMIRDALDEVGSKNFDTYCETLSEEEKSEACRVHQEIISQADLNPLYRRHIDKMDVTFMPYAKTKGIKAPVVLIHSESDTVLHTVESKQLYEDLRAHDVVAHLVVTPLLNHANMQLKLSLIPDIGRMVYAINLFLSSLKN